MDVLEVFAHRYSAQARLDHQIFVDLFQNGCIPGLAVDGEACAPVDRSVIASWLATRIREPTLNIRSR